MELRFWLSLLSFSVFVNAQFGGFFDQMFGGQQGGHQQQQQPNNPSDASHYRAQYGACEFETSFKPCFDTITNTYLYLAICDNYLCPDTLSCVHFPHHCPCAWDAQEDKFELGEGKRLCVSKGGFKAGEASRKVELARKGLL